MDEYALVDQGTGTSLPKKTKFQTNVHFNLITARLRWSEDVFRCLNQKFIHVTQYNLTSFKLKS